jgi:hypothetical protein
MNTELRRLKKTICLTPPVLRRVDRVAAHYGASRSSVINRTLALWVPMLDEQLPAREAGLENEKDIADA